MMVALRTGLLVCATSLMFAASAGAESPHVPHQVIVKYADSAGKSERAQARKNAEVKQTLHAVDGTGAEVVEVRGSAEAAMRKLNRSSAVLYAELNTMFHATVDPADPLYAQQDDLNNTGQLGGLPDADIDAPEGWNHPTLSPFPQTGGAKIGIVDTGIALNHPDLTGRTVDCGGVNNFGTMVIIFIVGADPTIVNGKCTDDHDHGTHVAGTIAANTNNGVGMAGIAYRSPLSICKGLNAQGSGTLVMIANCVTWLSQRGVKVISMSLGGTSGSAALQTAIQNATNNGALVVAASGNGGNSTPNYPAAYPEVVSVAATDNRDQKASFSTFNADVEIAAPGVNTLSTVKNGGYARFSGTSMATPHVAAVAGVIATLNQGMSVPALREKLTRNSVDDLGAPGRDVNFGWGRVNLAKAVQ